MLSTENPPPDPDQKSPVVPQLKSGSSIIISSDNNSSNNNSVRVDERRKVSSDDDHNQHQVLKEVVAVDLFNSGLDENNNNSNQPLPKFSIRDYVYNIRGENIKTHWPFSAKNLQLCLNHGVKDVLPPFQTLDSVRNRSTVKNAAEDTSNFDVKLSSFPVSSNNVGEKLALDIESTKLSQLKEDREYPSTTTSQSCSDINSVPIIKELQAENLRKKFEGSTQNPVKKCKVIVKLSNVVEPKSKDELSLNTSVVSETMASKMCPVCKTFTSSSNTTLNAHIDQCLSGESTAKWTANSKVIKHRIKPRKTKLMVDIYATALACTLEDLDRRNGTNWASNLGLPAQDMDACAEEKDKTFSSVNVEEKSEEGAVYVDSSGTKLRILSKFSDQPSASNAKDDSGTRKLIEREKGSKFISSKKKKCFVQKHRLLNPSYGQRSCSPRPDHCPEANDDEQINLSPEKSHEKDDLSHPFEACDKVKSNAFGMIKQWVGSERTGLKKKNNVENENRHPGKFVRNLSLKSSLSHGDKLTERARDLSASVSRHGSRNLSSESYDSADVFSYNSDDKMEQPCLRKRGEVSYFESRDFHGKRNDPMLSKCNAKQSKKDGSEKHASLRRNNRSINTDNSLISSRMSNQGAFSSRVKTSLDHAISRKFSSLRKDLLSVGHSSGRPVKKNLEKRNLDYKKRKLHFMSESDEEIHKQDKSAAGHLEKGSCKSPVDKYRFMKLQKKRGEFVNIDNGGYETFMGSEGSPQFDSDGGGTSNVPDAVKEVEVQNELACEPSSSQVGDEEAFVASDKALDSEYSGIAGSSNVNCVSQNYIKAYEEHGPADIVLSGEQNMFCADKDDGQGNYFLDVDPIPIPSPPGSFLPSPGRMGSEELQGNSSLTTCRIPSEENEHGNLVDMDSSDSPISATSIVSNSVQSQNEPQRDISQNRAGPVAEEQQKLDDSRENLILPEMMIPRRLNNNSQPCCCSRKEGFLQSNSLNYHDSQLLRRRTMTTVLTIRARENQMTDDRKKRPYAFDLRSETLPGMGPTAEPEKAVANPPMEYDATTALVSHGSESKFPTCGDGEFPSPSTSNPVLRLMGKNLMVVIKDENMSPQSRPTESNMVNERIPLDNTLSRVPSPFDNMQTCMPALPYDSSSFHGFKNHANYRFQELAPHPPAFGLPSKSFGDYGEYAPGVKMNTEQLGPKIRPKAPYEVEKVRRPEEIIVIDDSPENEGSVAVRSVHGEGLSVGTSASTVMGYNDPRHMNPFYSYQTRCYPVPSGSQIGQNAYIQMPPSKGLNANHVKWSLAREGSSVPHPVGSSPSTGHLRSSLYFPSGFP